MTNPNDLPNPVRHEVVGEAGGVTYETPLTLGPDSDHADDPLRGDNSQNGDVPTAPSSPTDEPASDGPLNPA